MTVPRLLLGVLCFPLLFVILVLFAVLVCVWRLVFWLSQFPSWLLAMTVVSALFAALCIVMAVRSW
ncbi:hypothetical protein [Streptomyces sp. NPDC047070]|uniref:hypothetical protein n=1 Tax=Streptomyces sp. NPDC047070 TaxID=3154923 RepID=UPI0034535D03